ncbi:MAG: site-specific DNA-methyltransferase [Tannerellaceae bacterium]|nr:site-specific DNA-methyltransferase [Tannerellaceae bacterium]
MIKNIIETNESKTPNSNEMTVLHKYFPQCFTNEGYFDIDRFQDLIKENVTVTEEGYNLNFLGKNYGKLLASIDTTTVIQPDTEHNSRPENFNSQNIYVSGDNLDALKHLLKSYAGKIKCIYIDPPYNTGSDGFVYNDNFSFTVEELSAKLSISEERAAKILDLTKRGSASHSAWLMFMLPRLQLAKDCLSNDGVIFISIDNNEIANLKLLCDSVFGEENFIEIFSWVKTSTPPSLSTKSRKVTEYVLCYERFRNDYKYLGELLDGGDQPLLNSGNKERTLCFSKEKVFFSSQKMRGQILPYTSERTSLLNEIYINDDGYADRDIILKGEFKWTENKLTEEIDKGTTFIIKSELLSIRFIRQGEGWKRPTNHIKEDTLFPLINKVNNGVETNEGASTDLESLMGTKIFSFPKPPSLIKCLMNFIIQDNDIVLDFFSGSGTTAEAVMQHNAKEGHNRNVKYILVQLPENLDENLKSADNPAK